MIGSGSWRGGRGEGEGGGRPDSGVTTRTSSVAASGASTMRSNDDGASPSTRLRSNDERRTRNSRQETTGAPRDEGIETREPRWRWSLLCSGPAMIISGLAWPCGLLKLPAGWRWCFRRSTWWLPGAAPCSPDQAGIRGMEVETRSMVPTRRDTPGWQRLMKI